MGSLAKPYRRNLEPFIFASSTGQTEQAADTGSPIMATVGKYLSSHERPTIPLRGLDEAYFDAPAKSAMRRLALGSLSLAIKVK